VGVLLLGAFLTVLLLMPVLDGPSKQSEARIKAEQVARAVLMYKEDHEGAPPATLRLLTERDNKGNGPYLITSDALLDPWGKPFQIDYDGKHNFGIKPDVWTTSPDGKTLGNWRDE
jgi:hypothetical protein